MDLHKATGTIFTNPGANQIIDADSEAMTLLNRGPDALLGLSLAELTATDDRTALAAAMHQLAKAGQCDWSTRLQMPDSSLHQFRFSARVCLSGNVVLQIEPNVATDTQQAIGEFHRLFDLAHDMFIVSDRNARIIAVNEACIKQHGGTLEDFIGRSLVEYTAPGGAEVLAEVAVKFRSGETHVRYQMPIYDAEGADAIVEGLTTFDRETQRWYTVQRNITQQVAQAEALSEATAAAQAAVEARSLFLANMSHEVRTPLNGVIGLTSLLLSTELTDDQREMLEAINGSGELLLNVINDILDFSKIDAGKMEIERLPTRIPVLLKGCYTLFLPLAETKGLRIEQSIDPALEHGLFAIDGPRVQQIINNLLSNALKFTESGTLNIAVNLESAGDEELILVVSIADTGIGMDEATLGRIFSAFTQADNSISRRFGGTGLGLSICQRLAGLMNGSLSTTSTLGVGSTFTLKLPVSRCEPVAEEEQATNEDLSFLSDRTLLVEDNPINRAVALRMLHHFGIAADLAANGRDAVDAVRQKAYSLVLMDMQMPVCSGPEATRLIRRDRQIHQPYIVALTANAMQSDRTTCLEAGMNSFLAKPLRLDNLAQTLAEVPRHHDGFMDRHPLPSR